MKLGFSLLSLFMKDVNEMLDIAVENGFDSVELLAEGPYRPDEMLGNKERCTVSYKDLANDVSINARVLIDDGLVEMKVIAINDGDVVCEVLNDGPVSDHKSVNVPDVNLRMDYMSRKDIEDIKFGIEQNVDFGAGSEEKTLQETITAFTKYACNRLKPTGAFVSASVYGAIIRSKLDAQLTGQNYVEMSRYLEYPTE